MSYMPQKALKNLKLSKIVFFWFFLYIMPEGFLKMQQNNCSNNIFTNKNVIFYEFVLLQTKTNNFMTTAVLKE